MARNEAMSKSQPPATRAKRPLSRKLVFSSLAVVLVFGVPELLLRLFWTPPAAEPVVGERQFVQWLSDLSPPAGAPKPLYREDRQRLWSLIPGAQIESFNLHYDPQHGERQPIRISINADGYRGPAASPRKPDGVFRVLCLGDSNIFGYPLDDEHTLPNALARALGRELAPRQVEVINAGTPGYTVVQGRLWYQQQFADYDYDWMVLAYLNNDAWPQPWPDSELLARREALPAWLSDLGGSLRLVRWGQSWRDRIDSTRELVPRVPLEDFIAGYQQLLQASREKGARALILDFRAYKPYEPYSQALEQIAEEAGVPYVPVIPRSQSAFTDAQVLRQYADLAKRVRRRWGTVLRERGYLWLYAEFKPEHLNEVGTAWLADELCPLLTAQASP
jgi:lysophospholipase L1-like esterase